MKQVTSKRKPFKTLIVLCCCIVAMSLMISCSKSSSPTPSQGKTAKFSITVNGATQNDLVTVVIVGGAVNQSKTIWKLNGTTQDNQESITLTQDQLAGSNKTYVIESTTSLQAISVGITCLGSSTHNYTISYSAVINGQVKNNDQNIEVSNNNDYNKDFSY